MKADLQNKLNRKTRVKWEILMGRIPRFRQEKKHKDKDLESRKMENTTGKWRDQRLKYTGKE